MTSETPKFRPLERFWPYAELPEQPTDQELAALDPKRETPSMALWVQAVLSIVWLKVAGGFDGAARAGSGWG